jgi:hypothetical protein
MERKFRGAAMMLAASAVSGLVGCTDESTSSGKLTLRITDAPVDAAEHVYVQFSGLELHGSGGRNATLYFCEDAANPALRVVSKTVCAKSKPIQIDLMDMNSGKSDVLLSGYALDAGNYQWVRLMVDTAAAEDTYIVLKDGAEHELTIPSADQTGLKLNRGFTVPAGGDADFTIDFDLRKSVHQNANGYVLRPTLRIVDNTVVGSIAGEVDAALVTANCAPTVYVFSGSNVTPDDVDGTQPDPVTTATVKLNDGNGKYEYKAAFLEAGNYTVAFTCDAENDDPATSEALTFVGTGNVTVTAKTTTPKDF